MIIKTYKSITSRVLDKLGKSKENIENIYYVTAKIKTNNSYKTEVDFRQVLMIQDEIIVSNMKNKQFETTIYNLKNRNIHPIKIEYKHSYDRNTNIVDLEEIIDVSFLEKNNIIMNLTNYYKPKCKSLSTGTTNWNSYINLIKAIYEYQIKNMIYI